MSFPIIDDRIHTFAISRLRQLNAAQLESLVANGHLQLIHQDHKPLAVLVSYETYLQLQTERGAEKEKP
jgi:hypothetical protein